jgi:4-hydroxythreonine-4-phosphate dehydrogenase
MSEKLIGITMGDACGVGPELVARAYTGNLLPEHSVVYGEASALELAGEKLDLSIDPNLISDPDQAQGGKLNLIDTGLLQRGDITIGQVSAAAGDAAVQAVQTAVRDSLDKKIAGFATLPINKEAGRHRHPDFQGHTELIAEMCGVTDYTMMLAAPDLIVTHVSTHVPLLEAIARVRRDRVHKVIKLTHDYLTRIRPRARIAVAGLNPHAGEHGAFGKEDQEHIEPAVEQARAEGLDVHGPLPPDTLFMAALKGAYDAVVCMYHDQGHIPMKMHDFASAVNVTLGLPIIRTSVDHGTAFDIAYQGKASTDNFENALKLARQLA